jgi:hypothetical protein
VSELIDDLPEAQVVRPEVVAPLVDAVSLIDDEQARPGLIQRLEYLRLLELLRRHEDELDFAALQRFEYLRLPGRGEGRIQPNRFARRRFCERFRLVLLERQ